MAALILDRLTKRYGTARGVESLSFQVEDGELFGFIGPNGAGKSTTIRTLLGLLQPTSCRAELLGRDLRDGAAVRQDIGYVSSETHLYEELSVGALLEFAGRFRAQDTRPRRRELADVFALDLAKRVGDLSLGNRKKVALVAALQHRPRLVILDEPTNGLDPLIQARLFEVLQEETRRGVTVFFSSHVLSEVQRVCRRVAILRECQLVSVEDVSALRARQVFARIAEGRSIAPLQALAGASSLTREGPEVRLLFTGDPPTLLRALAEAGPEDVRIEEPTLEEIFLGHYLDAKKEVSHVAA